MINLRDNVIPVMNLRVQFGMNAFEDSSETCIAVLKQPGVSARYAWASRLKTSPGSWI